MEINKVDEANFEFWHKHYVKLGGLEKVKHHQFKFKLYPYYGEGYCGSDELIEIIKKEEKMAGESIFIKQFSSIDAMALAQKFSVLKKMGVEVDDFVDEKFIITQDIYFFVAYVYTLDQKIDPIRYSIARYQSHFN